MLKKLLRRILRQSGYDIVRLDPPPADAPVAPDGGAARLLASNLNLDERLGYDLEDEAVSAIHVVRQHTMLAKRRLVTLYEQVAYCERNAIPGAFVECGVWKAGAVGLMAIANLRRSPRRRPLHLFDAFDDICEPDAAVDGDRAVREARELSGSTEPAGRLQALPGFYDRVGGHGTLGEARHLLEQAIGYDPAFLHYHVGWFQETLPQVHEEIGPIALLRLDGDWYASTMVCLEHLYDKVVPGGIVILDDYGAYEGCRRAVDEYLARRDARPYLSPVDSDCRYFIKS